MMAVLTPWWRDRTPRERFLLLIALALAGITLASFAVLRPVAAARQRAEARVDAAVAARAEVARLGGAIRTAQQRASGDASSAADIVGRRLAEAGIMADTLTPQPGGAVQFRITAVRGALLQPLLQAVEQREGLVIDTLVITRNADATIAVDITARRPA